jgi:hypothetical protein
MHVTSKAGTDLNIQMKSAVVGGGWGFCAKPGMVSHWPGGLALAFPAAGSVNGTLVMAPGDVNLTFKRYLRETIHLTIENDTIVRIEGQGVQMFCRRRQTQRKRLPTRIGPLARIEAAGAGQPALGLQTHVVIAHHLAREPQARRRDPLRGENMLLRLRHRGRLAGDKLHPAGGAAAVAAAGMELIDPALVDEGVDQPLAGGNFEITDAIDRNLGHETVS